MEERSESNLKVNFSCSCAELQNELEATKIKLTNAEKEVAKLERQLAITDGYNEDLRQQLNTLSAQLHAFKTSAISTRTFCDASTEYEEQQNGEMETIGEVVLTPTTAIDSASANQLFFCPPFQDPLAILQNSEMPAESVKSLMDEIRETSESAVAQSSFIYDPQTGMYYDSQSGYYYDAEKSLYYDVYSGCYYYYDCAMQSYQFHSQVDYAKYSTLSHVILNRKNDAANQMDVNVDSSVQKKTKKPKSRRKHEQEKCSRQVCLNEANTTDDTDENLQQKMRRNFREKLKRHKDKKRNIKSLSPANDFMPVRLIGHCAEFLKNSVLSRKLNISSCCEGKESIDLLKQLSDSAGKEDIRGSAGESGSNSATDCSSFEMELEEGELSSSSLSSDSEEFQSCSEENDNAIQLQPEFLRCTPCIRVIVKSSDYLPFGNLYIVTCTAVATIGRDASLNHAILIPDPAISKMHCDIKYNDELQRYMIQDHASQCGTYVNGKRLSEAKVISEPCTLYNGDVLRISKTVLDLHIHPGHDTCMNCEPGNLLGCQTPSSQKESVVMSKEEKEQQRRQQVKAMKKKYGLQKMDFEVNGQPMDKTRYQDRAADRRAKHGSDNPHQRDDQPSSVNKAIASENVGHKLLSKMGWKEGESLGKSQQGIKEPIQANLRYDQSAGLGSEGNLASADDVVHVHSSKKWVKARQRYNKIAMKGDKAVEKMMQNHNSMAEDERKSDCSSGDAVPDNAAAAAVFKRLWVKSENVEPALM